MEPASEQDKRRRSSDGTTPKPKQKQVKMASGEHSYNAGDILDRMTIIAEAIEGLQKGQSKLQSTWIVNWINLGRTLCPTSMTNSKL